MRDVLEAIAAVALFLVGLGIICWATTPPTGETDEEGERDA